MYRNLTPVSYSGSIKALQATEYLVHDSIGPGCRLARGWTRSLSQQIVDHRFDQALLNVSRKLEFAGFFAGGISCQLELPGSKSLKTDLSLAADDRRLISL